MHRRTFLIGTAALAVRPAFAQEAFPSHAITILNAFPPGGRTSHQIARLLL